MCLKGAAFVRCVCVFSGLFVIKGHYQEHDHLDTGTSKKTPDGATSSGRWSSAAEVSQQGELTTSRMMCGLINIPGPQMTISNASRLMVTVSSGFPDGHPVTF